MNNIFTHLFNIWRICLYFLHSNYTQHRRKRIVILQNVSRDSSTELQLLILLS